MVVLHNHPCVVNRRGRIIATSKTAIHGVQEENFIYLFFRAKNSPSLPPPLIFVCLFALICRITWVWKMGKKTLERSDKLLSSHIYNVHKYPGRGDRSDLSGVGTNNLFCVSRLV